MRHAVWVPLFDELSDPAAVAQLAEQVETAGWDGLFVWDHVRWREPRRPVGDPWVSLAAAATVTSTIRLGPVVTPLPRRRPAVLARQTVALDRLSGGRLVFGAGLGSDRFAEEYSRFGEPTDARTHAAMADESLAVLTAAWTGDPVDHDHEHFRVADVTFLPRPVQRPSIPIWIAGSGSAAAPRRRAARHQGIVPLGLSGPDELATLIDDISTLRAAVPEPGAGDHASHDRPGAGHEPQDPFDVVAILSPDEPGEPYASAGATWAMRELDADSGVDTLRSQVSEGPPP